ncbi:MAG: nitrite reductase (NAD(P)H) small subunit, partial [Betaproteobacteria bacterium]|nr:nitrite reductase (NAD(P)H) small subunit [Betaproteobacteria bacterium]
TCPLHGWVIELDRGTAIAPDTGCTPTFAVRVTEGRIELAVPHLDALATA